MVLSLSDFPLSSLISFAKSDSLPFFTFRSMMIFTAMIPPPSFSFIQLNPYPDFKKK